MPIDWNQFTRDKFDPHGAVSNRPVKVRAVPSFISMEFRPKDTSGMKNVPSLSVSAHRSQGEIYALKFAVEGFKSPADVEIFRETVGRSIRFILETCSDWDRAKIESHQGSSSYRADVPFQHGSFSGHRGLEIQFHKCVF